MRFLRRALVGLFLVSLTLGLLGYAGGTFMAALEERAARDAAPRVARERVFGARVVTITPQTIAPVMASFGEIESRRALEVRATQGGRIVELGPRAEEGGRVTAGQLLFRIDPVEAERALAIARTDLLDAEGELDDARTGAEIAIDELASAQAQVDLRARSLQRQEDLQTRGVGTTTAVEEAELALSAADQAVLSRRQALATATARVNQAQTRLARTRIEMDEAERALADTEITAAFDGVLSDLSVVAGGLVSVNERLADLIDPAALEVAFRVSTAEYARLLDENADLPPLEVRVALDVDGFVLESGATITRESAAVGEGQSGRLLFAALEQPQGFRADDFVRVMIAEPPLDAVARLPAAAVDANDTVLVLGDGDRLQSAEVTVLRRQGDDVLVRARGLAGAEVVAERSPLLGSGIAINPIRPAPDGTETAALPELLELSSERRARLVAFVEGNTRMPPDAKARVLAQLREDRVPARVVERIEGRMGG